MAKTSAKSAAAAAKRVERETLRTVTKDQTALISGVTRDSFVNFAHKLGIGADNVLSTSSYGFNPLSRNRTLLEWIHRGSWIAGQAVDVVAEDMTREGVDFATEIPPDQQDIIDRKAVELNIWATIAETIQWGRLYGGAIAVVLIDGQDPRTPLRLDTVGPKQFKGMLTLDRWQIEAAVDDLVTDYGPHLGLPKYYRVQTNAPALRMSAIHYSRVVVRHVGVRLPYQQQLVENLWGISVLERLYDRMITFDMATTGISQLVNKAYLRTLTVEGLRDVVAAGGKALDGLTSYVDMMRRFQGIEGMTLIDSNDKFEALSHGSFTGLSDVLTKFGEQLSGALKIPLVRLFGQSPSGLNSTGESDLRMYYDSIRQSQQRELFMGVNTVYKLIARSEGIALPSNFVVNFKPLWQLTEADRASVAKTTGEVVQAAHESGLLSQKSALKELRQSSRITGIFTNITHEQIEAADDQLQAPGSEDLLSSLTGGGSEAPPADLKPGQLPTSGSKPSGGLLNGNEAETARPQGSVAQVDQSTGGRKALQLSTPQRRPTNRGAGPGAGS